MAAPVWKTPAGSLGTIAEAEFYDFQLEAVDSDGEDLTFSLQSGKLPNGLRVRDNGLIEGIPSNVSVGSVVGVPSQVNQDVESRFVVRVKSKDNIVSDRTFELIVSGPDAPVILTQEGQLGEFKDGEWVDITISATDADNDTLTYEVIGGELPPGLNIGETTGKITGWIEPIPTIDGTIGFDATPFDAQPFDFRTQSVNRNYQFTIAASDGNDRDAATYTIFVWSANTFTADTTQITTDSTTFTSDITSLRRPVFTTTDTSLGEIRHDNYFAHQFTGRDFDGDPIIFELGTGSVSDYTGSVSTLSVPSGLVLDENTGWLYGTLPNQNATEVDYTFLIRVKKKGNPEYKSDWTEITMTLVGNTRKVITWLTDSDLGSINVGEVSTFRIESTNTLNRSVEYSLASGKLPQGLRLQQDGLIVGRPSFKTFMVDSGTTTFDNDTTTFERKRTFTVRIKDPEGVINTTKEFTITVVPGEYKPYENLWVRAFPPVEQRNIWRSLIDSNDDFPPDLIYRQSDYWFGKQNDLRFIVNYGLNPETISDYIRAMARNHYNKRIRLGDIKKAQALDNNGNVMYEVVYADVVEKEVNNNGKSPSLSINLKENIETWSNPITSDNEWPYTDTSLYTSDQSDDYVVYPNSFSNMNTRIRNAVGRFDFNSLPRWMTSKQEDGKVLGLTHAVVIAYVNPGAADKIIFNINNRTDIDLKKIEFAIDRYIWDSDMSTNYDKDTNQWEITTETTFDLQSGDQTTFDDNNTRFFTNVDVYKEQRDDGDAYLHFPREAVFR